MLELGDRADDREEPTPDGSRTKTVLTDNAGKVEVTVPRDRIGAFEPVIVPKHHRKLGSMEELVLSLSSRGLTSGEISAHFAETFPRRREVPPGASVS